MTARARKTRPRTWTRWARIYPDGYIWTSHSKADAMSALRTMAMMESPRLPLVIRVKLVEVLPARRKSGKRRA